MKGRGDRKERIHRRLVRAYRQGSSYRWVAALMASYTVGRYARGETAAIASDLAVSMSQVESLARAGEAYKVLRKHYPNPCQLHDLRQRLTPTHFAALGELWHKYEFEPCDAIEMLQITADNGGSVISLREGIESTFGHNGYAEWEKRMPKVIKLVGKLVNDFGVPEQVREKGKEFLSVMCQEFYAPGGTSED